MSRRVESKGSKGKPSAKTSGRASAKAPPSSSLAAIPLLSGAALEAETKRMAELFTVRSPLAQRIYDAKASEEAKAKADAARASEKKFFSVGGERRLLSPDEIRGSTCVFRCSICCVPTVTFAEIEMEREEEDEPELKAKAMAKIAPLIHSICQAESAMHSNNKAWRRLHARNTMPTLGDKEPVAVACFYPGCPDDRGVPLVTRFRCSENENAGENSVGTYVRVNRFFCPCGQYIYCSFQCWFQDRYLGNCHNYTCWWPEPTPDQRRVIEELARRNFPAT